MTTQRKAPPVVSSRGPSDRLGSKSATTIPICFACHKAARMAAAHLGARGLWGSWQAKALRASCASTSCPMAQVMR